MKLADRGREIQSFCYFKLKWCFYYFTTKDLERTSCERTESSRDGNSLNFVLRENTFKPTFVARLEFAKKKLRYILKESSFACPIYFEYKTSHTRVCVKLNVHAIIFVLEFFHAEIATFCCHRSNQCKSSKRIIYCFSVHRRLIN
jgi:hypothetical protein